MEWRKGPDMPFTMGGNIQALEIEGTVYVGGGTTLSSSHDGHIMMAYDTRSNQWYSLPRYSARYFSMTVVNSKLVLVGGNCSGTYSRQLGVWQTNDRHWMQPFPPMPTARSRASSTCCKHWLVVAGGYKDYRSIDTVEVLDVNTNQWSTGPSTPTPWDEMKSVVIENTWYLMGGSCISDCDVYSASLETIVTMRPSRSSRIWQKLTPLNSKFSCPLNIEGSLLAVGGLKKNNEETAAIMRYIPETSTWVTARELPQALHECTCISVADKIYLFGGTIKYRYLKDMYYHTY